MEKFTLTTRDLDEEESIEMFEWIYLNSDHILVVEEMTVRDIRKITVVWKNGSVMNGNWTVSLSDIDLAIYFRLKWT